MHAYSREMLTRPLKKKEGGGEGNGGQGMVGNNMINSMIYFSFYFWRKCLTWN
jgi:hypothetical protein